MGVNENINNTSRRGLSKITIVPLRDGASEHSGKGERQAQSVAQITY